MLRNDKFDIIIIIGPDNPGDKTTQKFLQEKLKQRIAHFKEQGLTVKVIGNGKDPVKPAELENLPKSKTVMLCGHGSTHAIADQDDYRKAHHISLGGQSTDTNKLIEKIQGQTGATQFVLASCSGGKVNENFQYDKNAIKHNTEIIALAPPNDRTSMYYALNSVLSAVNEIGSNKIENKDTNLSNIYANLIQTSPNAVSYGARTRKRYAMTECNPKDMLYFLSGVLNADFISDNYQRKLDNFKSFLSDNNLPALPAQPNAMQNVSDKYKREYLDDFILRADLTSVTKIIKDSPAIMKEATRNVRNYIQLMNKGGIQWANGVDNYIKMLKTLAHYDMDHNRAANMMAMFTDMKENRLPQTNKNFLKCALIDMAGETNDDKKRSYLVRSLLYAEGSHLLEGVEDEHIASVLRDKLNPAMIEQIKQATLKDACQYAMMRFEQSPSLTLKQMQDELSTNLDRISWLTNCDMKKEMREELYNNPRFCQIQIQGMHANQGKYNLAEITEFKPNPLMNNNDNNKKSAKNDSSSSIMSKLSGKSSQSDDSIDISVEKTSRAKPVAIEAPKATEELHNNNESQQRIRAKN